MLRVVDRETLYLYDAQLMSNGVIVRQCPPMDMNIFFCEFEEFEMKFEPALCQD